MYADLSKKLRGVLAWCDLVVGRPFFTPLLVAGTRARRLVVCLLLSISIMEGLVSRVAEERV
jgi:hypothetical protein